MTDLELLKQYGQTHSDAAFAELVRRHLDWVYSAAVRQVHDRHLAEDVVQGVFITLARRAKALGRDEPLSPWLLRVTRCAAISAMRAVSRRERHEQKAAAMRPESTMTMTEAGWEELAPVLDEGVLRLGKKDREAVVLRFYERKSLREVGEAMGVSEEAARKRVGRGIVKLRELIAKKVPAASVAGLAAALGAKGVEAAPAGLAEAAIAAVGSGGAGTAGAIAKGAMKMMAWAKVKVAAGVVLAVSAGVAAVAWSARSDQPPALQPATTSVSQQASATIPAVADPTAVPELPVIAEADLAALKQAIRNSEQALKNIHVQVVAVRQRWNPVLGAWESDREVTATAWYVGLPHIKARVNIRKEVSGVTNGSAPLVEKHYTVGFDGKAGYALDESRGPVGSPTPVLRGKITGDRPFAIQSLNDFVTGWGYSLYGIMDIVASRLSNVVPDRPVTIASVLRTRVQDTPCVQIITYAPSGYATEYDLDPAKDFALLKWEWRAKEGTVLSRLTVKTFIAAAPHVFYPKEAVYEDFCPPGRKKGEPNTRILFTASTAVANDPKFTDEVFKIKWPARTDFP